MVLWEKSPPIYKFAYALLPVDLFAFGKNMTQILTAEVTGTFILARPPPPISVRLAILRSVYGSTQVTQLHVWKSTPHWKWNDTMHSIQSSGSILFFILMYMYFKIFQRCIPKDEQNVTYPIKLIYTWVNMSSQNGQVHNNKKMAKYVGDCIRNTMSVYLTEHKLKSTKCMCGCQ